MPTIESWRSAWPGSRSSSARRAEVAGAARRAVDLAVGEDRDVALVQRRRARRRGSCRRCPRGVVVGVARHLGALERALDLAARGDQLVESLGHDLEPEVGGRHAGVDRAAVGDVDARRPPPPPRARSRRPARCGTSTARPPRRAQRTRATTRPDGTSIVTVASPSGAHAIAARLDRPRAERDRAVPARGRVAVLVPEQHAEVGAGVVGRDREAAVHVGVPARLVAQQPAHASTTSALPRACSRRSRTVAPGISGAPPVTMRNGSPAVW